MRTLSTMTERHYHADTLPRIYLTSDAHTQTFIGSNAPTSEGIAEACRRAACLAAGRHPSSEYQYIVAIGDEVIAQF
jgi:hypothetical protein